VRAPAPAKINLALIVGPLRDDGKHEVLTVLQRVGLSDRIDLEPAPTTSVAGFPDDTLVRDALRLLAERAATNTGWRVRIEKKIPAAAGLGGGSSDAATALRLANDTLEKPLPPPRLHALAGEVGADTPFFLTQGPQLGQDDGTKLTPLDLPQDYWVVLVLPHGAEKPSSAAVYADFDERDGGKGFRNRRAVLKRALADVGRAADLAPLPTNDLASSPLAADLLDHGAFRADVTGAGPVVYGLFQQLDGARKARSALDARGRTWLTVPTWYG
jgi:4-diphosphocytidyl-2-C-methyl-D-erythritol kinase